MTQPLRILHLEGEPDDAELVRAALTKDGLACEIQVVSTRDEFRAALERSEIDLILSDFGLAGFDGRSALLMASETAPDVPFVLVSGNIGEESVIGSLRSGATDYVLKHHLTRLGPAVRRALDEADERRKRHMAELALQNEQQFLRALLENLDAGILACDAAGKITFFNRNTVEFQGLPENPLPSMEWKEHYSLYHPDGKTPMAREEIPLFRAFHGDRVRNAEVVVQVKGESPRTLLVSGQPIVDAVRGKMGAVVAMHDITERKSLEIQLRQAQKMEAVGRLAAGIAHDFNNLLSVMLGYGELLQRGLPAAGPLRTGADEIVRASERAADLTRQLLAFSRKQILEPRVLDPPSVLAGMEKMLRRLLGADIELRMKLAADVGRVKADPGQLEQVVMNLVVNARDAMPEGGTITIETANVELDSGFVRTHAGSRPGPYVVIAVSDTGTGMTPDVQAQIFEPFFTTKEQGKGTGLGLSTVYGIVKQSDGYVSVHSEPGHGATFRVFLPLLHQAVAETNLESGEGPACGTGTVLIAEDDAALRSLLRQHLESAGYVALEAPGPREALGVAAGHPGPIHLLLTDVVMPVMNGRALAERLSGVRPETSVLYISGYTAEAISERGILREGTSFLSKPFTRDALVRKVREVLDMRARCDARVPASK